MPFRYGDHIAKFSVAPVAPALTGSVIDASDRPDAIRETMRSEMRRIGDVWDSRVRLCRDLARRPVEEPIVAWDEDEAPFQRVATITVRPQDSRETGRVAAGDAGMRFGVWAGLAAHRPLGNVDRARDAPRRHAADFRRRFDGCPVHEPATGD